MGEGHHLPQERAQACFVHLIKKERGQPGIRGSQGGSVQQPGLLGLGLDFAGLFQGGQGGGDAVQGAGGGLSGLCLLGLFDGVPV